MIDVLSLSRGVILAVSDDIFHVRLCPLCELIDDWYQRFAGFSQRVFHFWRHLRINFAVDESVGLKRFECGRKYAGRYVWNDSAQFIESHCAFSLDYEQDKQRPFIAETDRKSVV